MESQKKILIVEDDADLVESVKLVLGSKNHAVSVAYDTIDGFKKIKEIKPDLILLDVMFGSENLSNGFDLAIKVRQDKEISSIPILMISSVNVKMPHFRFSPDTDGEYLPVDDFINKPAQPEELLSKAEKLLEKKKSSWSNWPEVEK